MKKRVLSLLLVFVMVLGLLPTGVLAADGATEVSDQSGLAGMTEGGSYILTADIGLSEWTAIDFSGTLDGNGHTITLTGQPLFNELSGNVQNLLLDGSVTSEGNIGALCNTMKTGSAVQNCWSGADVTATGDVAYAAGFTGKIEDGLIQDCLATGELTGGKWGDTYGITGGGTADIQYSPTAINCWFVNGTRGVQYGDGHTCTKVVGNDYTAALAALNAAADKSGLLTWDATGGIPRPVRGASGGDGGDEGGEPAEKTELEQLLEQAEVLNEADYAAGSWRDLQGIIAAAKDPDADVADAVENLQLVLEYMVTANSYNALKEQYDLVQTEYLPNYKNYTSESWSAVSVAFGNADGMLFTIDAATQDDYVDNTEYKDADVSAAAKALTDAINGLMPVEIQDYTIDSLEDLQTMDGSGNYTLETDLILPAGWSSSVTLSGTFDGGGHVITMQDGGPLLGTITGEVRNLGIAGTVNGSGAFANILNGGTIFNCYSWANVNNGDQPAGGIVGKTHDTGIIRNTYASGQVTGSPANGLAGEVLYYNFTGSYWLNGGIASDMEKPEQDQLAGKQITLEEMKGRLFSYNLNQNLGQNGKTWNRSKSGLPYFGETVESNVDLPYKVVLTDLYDKSTQTITKEERAFVIDIFGTDKPDGTGYLAQFSIPDYKGSVEWECSGDNNSPVRVSTSGKVYVTGPGLASVTAQCGDKEVKFDLLVVVPEFTLGLRVEYGDWTNPTKEGCTNKTFTLPENTNGVQLTPMVILDGKTMPADPRLFDWSSDNANVINVDSTGWAEVKEEGIATMTAKLDGKSVWVRLESGYTPIEQIECAFSGTYTIHRRSPNSIGQNGTPGEASFNPLRHLKDGEEWVGSEEMMANVTPEGATYADSYTVTTDNSEVMQFKAALVQNLIPMKAGTVNVTVTTKDPHLGEEQLSDTKEVTLKYLNPLKELSVKEKTLTVKVGETIDAGLIFTGENDTTWPEKYSKGLHVSESYMTWEQSGGGEVLAYRSYPVIMQGDEDFSLEEGTVSNDQWLIKGVKEGTVTLTGTAKDTTNGKKTVTLTITVEAGDPSLNKPVEEQVADALAKTGEYQFNALDNAPAFLNEWSILGLARADYTLSDEFVETYYASAYQEVQEQKSATSRPWDNKITETQRLALALTSIGKDPTDVGGVNLLDYSWNKETYWNGAVLGDMQGSNELIYALLAINAHDSFQQPGQVSMTEQEMIDKLLRDYQAPEGGFGLSGPSFDVDITGMALQALAPYYDTRDDVKEAVDKAVTHLSQAQGTDGSYGNPEATSQVIVALCTLGIDPDKDDRFIKAGSSLVDGLLMYALEDGSFRHSMNGGSDGMATEQALYTLASLSRFYAKPRGNSLYDMNDVTIGGSGGTTVTGVTLTPASAKIETGKTVQLNALVIPATAANKNVTFSSSKPEVATVSKTGLVTGVAEGTATITVTTVDGNKTATSTITVTKPEEIKPEDKATVTLSIDKLTIDKGYVLEPTEVEIKKGETVWDVLKREMDQRGIRYQYSNNSQYNSVYVESIDGDGEFDHGSGSGWKYSVNGVYPDYGCSRYTLTGGEVIKWRYTTNLGMDLGDDPNAGLTGKPEEGGSAILQPEVKPDKNGNAKVTVDETQMKDAIATAKTEGSSAIVIAPQVTGEAKKVMTEVSTQSLKDVVKNTDAALEVQTGVGSVSIPNDALNSLTRQAGGSTVAITVEAKKPENVKDQVSASQLENAMVVEVTITSGKKELTTFDGKSLTVIIPVTGSAFVSGETYKVIVLSADGSKETVSGTCIKQNGKLSMQVKITHLSTFVVTTQKTMPFTDLSGHWAAEAITYVYGNSLMNGTSDTTFAPDESLNRAMLATILYRLSGEPAAAGEGKTFMDVAPDTWYTSAVAWASANGIVSGVGDGKFAPTQAITREELATMFYRCAKYSKLDTSAKGDLSKFADNDQIAAWASDAMAWAVGTGLISGKNTNVIDPTGTATRAEVATILMRFTELTK